MSEPASNYHCISAGEALALLRAEAQVKLFDVRDLESYRRHHIEGAAHLAEDRFPFWLRRIERDAPVVIYCYHGNASKVYAQMFADFRFSRVYSVDGGYAALVVALDSIATA